MEKHPYRGNEGRCVECGNPRYDSESHFTDADFKKINSNEHPLEPLVSGQNRFEPILNGLIVSFPDNFAFWQRHSFGGIKEFVILMDDDMNLAKETFFVDDIGTKDIIKILIAVIGILSR